MRARLAILPMLLVLISTTLVAHAQHAAPAPSPSALPFVPAVPAVPAAPAAPPKTRRVYYGGQVLLCDLASMALLFGGVTAPIGVGGYFLGGPIVHARRGNPRRAAQSAAMRVGLPLVGATAGVVAGVVVDDSSDSLIPVLFGFAGATVGALSAMIIDAAALSWEKRPVPAGDSLVVVPQVSLGEHGVSLGVLGRF